MVIVPKDKPYIENLNSYYLNVPRLLEHYQGELGSGAIHFKSPSAEGVIFFDREEFLEGSCEKKDEKLTGKAAVDFLLGSSGETSYVVSIYDISAEKVYFWSSIPAAKRIYEDLSAEFTDLEGLMRKMSGEKLTGYIEVSLGMGAENAFIFYNNGQILGSFYSWDEGEMNASKDKLHLLAQKTKKSGGTFHVSRVSMEKEKEAGNAKKTENGPSPEIVTAMEELLGLVDGIVGSSKVLKGEFHTLLKKRFLDLAETYPFLDPFRGELEYSNRKIKISGKLNDQDLVKGVLAAVRGLADDLNLGAQFQAKTAPWFQKYGAKLNGLGIAH
jgi:hypothetical protein